MPLRNEYFATENRIPRNQIKGQLRLTDGEIISPAEIGKKLAQKALEEVACIVNPDTILGGNKRLISKKFDGSVPHPDSWTLCDLIPVRSVRQTLGHP